MSEDFTKEKLKQLQSMPLEAKVYMTQARIQEWYRHYNGKVYVSFSGGKDSTVLLNIVRKMYPDVEAAFVDTGLEYPEIREHVKTFDNVTWLKPDMSFNDVIKKYGYPVISKEVSECIDQARKCKDTGKYTYRAQMLEGTFKDKNGNLSMYNKEQWKFLLDAPFKISNLCCNVMKKKPAHSFTKQSGKKPMTGQMAAESMQRESQWLKNGCNGFDMKSPVSNPLSFWTEQDILQYIKEENIKIASVYGDIVSFDGECEYDNTLIETKLRTTGVSRTGCMFCMFGVHLEKEPNRFQRMKITHPEKYEYCIGGGTYKDGLWMPTKKGLGLGKVLDFINVPY